MRAFFLFSFLITSLHAKANVIVSKDGSGQFKTVQEAVAAAPDNGKSRFIIFVKTGVYVENVYIGKRKTNLTIIGDGQDRSILTGSIYAVSGKIKTMNTATLAVEGDGFMAQNIGIRNTAGPERGPAVALRVSTVDRALRVSTVDRAIIFKCRIDGFQDTLYAQANHHFYRECHISGTVDFIFGRAAAVFQRCRIEARNHNGNINTITAQSREYPKENSGFIMQKCSITAAADLAPSKKTYLGRPWRQYARVVIMETVVDGVIDPAGWIPWENGKERPQPLSNLYFAEYANTGPGADTSHRVNWTSFHVLKNQKEAFQFTPGKFFLDDSWITLSKVPYDSGF